MKVFISADMEGVSGITDWEDVLPGKRTYEYSRKLFTDDVNAAIEGAIEGGATQIIVNEAHGPMRNLIPDQLHPKAELVRGFYKPLLMMQGLDETFDTVFFVGYHGKGGEMDALMNHTFLGSCIQRFYLNGKEASEADFNAIVSYMPQVELLDSRKVRYVSNDLIEASKVLTAMILLAIQASNTMTF
ncbi:M55 family metallopeptidase [Bacillus sp. CGMCC 1.16607]|uniref:M55 family metallopeptidase n=1 Tax=Bacillus sp. CGMCC 1.16607 TaxID=3351842 RepID=UPI0036291573